MIYYCIGKARSRLAVIKHPEGKFEVLFAKEKPLAEPAPCAELTRAHCEAAAGEKGTHNALRKARGCQLAAPEMVASVSEPGNRAPAVPDLIGSRNS